MRCGYLHSFLLHIYSNQIEAIGRSIICPTLHYEIIYLIAKMKNYVNEWMFWPDQGYGGKIASSKWAQETGNGLRKFRYASHVVMSFKQEFIWFKVSGWKNVRRFGSLVDCCRQPPAILFPYLLEKLVTFYW